MKPFTFINLYGLLKWWLFYLFTLANRQITIKVWWGGKW